MEISVGAVLEGTIKSITKFGAFVTLPGGRSGLVHISEISPFLRGQCQRRAQRRTGGQSEGGQHRRGRTDQSVHEESRAPLLPGPKAPAETGRTGLISVGIPAAQAAAGQPPSQPRPQGPWAAPQPTPGPADFEARLKQFMQASDSKLSDLKMTENAALGGRPPLNPPTFARILPTARRGLAHPGPLRAVFCALWAAEGQGTGDIAPPGAESQRISHKKL